MDNTCVTIVKNAAPTHTGMGFWFGAAKECHNALVLLRSANKSNERNLIPIGLRKALIEDAVGHERGMKGA